VTDTLEYQLVDERGGRRFVLQGRAADQRRGIQLANESAFAAITSLLRQVSDGPLDLASVSLRHPRPADDLPHREFFGCEVNFDASFDALPLSDAALATATRLADDGLSAFLLSQLDDLHSQRAERSLVMRVRAAVTDALCEGVPRKGQ